MHTMTLESLKTEHASALAAMESGNAHIQRKHEEALHEAEREFKIAQEEKATLDTALKEKDDEMQKLRREIENVREEIQNMDNTNQSRLNSLTLQFQNHLEELKNIYTQHMESLQQQINSFQQTDVSSSSVELESWRRSKPRTAELKTLRETTESNVSNLRTNYTAEIEEHRAKGAVSIKFCVVYMEDATCFHEGADFDAVITKIFLVFVLGVSASMVSTYNW
ncbi:hypothetical protein BC938DRAFT_480850 [Jimgerdemannia flammicorona]|uniref:Uncharacterized protein n=1 Tax=Jimgerdemannia flammicorona TaxID=994334 RepID=A0A433QHP2_9FUNG|nr:hypothetical protein BC938DRAFT_480850 [Jimgerdemannia flammicorona]